MKQAIIKLAAQWFSARTPEKQGGGGRPAERPNVFEFAYWSRPQPTLIVDRDEVTAKQLAEQLGHCGFETDFANSYVAAEGAVRTKYYRTIIVVIESDSSIDWDGLSRLRKRVLGSWIICRSSDLI